MTELVRALAARQVADYRTGTPGTFFADPGRPRLVIELHNYVFRGQPPTLQELVANNGIHAGVVLPPPGAETPWHGDEPLTGRLTVEIDGTCVDDGPMDGVPGGPAGSLRWLTAHLAGHGLSLRPGQLILTGTPLGLIRVRPGAHIQVTAERLGAVEATVGA
jgi:2-keto-4-pentenoate hydratase